MFISMFTRIFIILLSINALVLVRCKQNVGDLCTARTTGNRGTCLLIKDCPQAVDDIFIQPCDPPGTVCCQNIGGRLPGVVSKEKCREYSKYVTEQTDTSQAEKNKCGQVTSETLTANTDKRPVATKEFPHVVVLGYETSPENISWNCVGVIISEQYILTVAHCVRSATFGPPRHVKMGITDLSDQSEHKQEYTIAEHITHPDYKSSRFYNDIALMKLEKPIKLGPYVRPACLNTHSEITAKKALAVGWTKPICENGVEGLTTETLNFYNHTVCNQTYNTISSRRLPQGIIDDIQFCAGSRTESLCEIISGGPLQILHDSDDVKCMYDIVGIASFGKSFTDSPDVYVRVSHYIKWIEDIVWPQKA